MDRSIVISNGRCGSTLLSDLIVDEPETLSVQEFFTCMAPWPRITEVLSGREYWNVLASPKPELAVLFRLGVPPKEVRYPATGRYAGDLATLPRILAITLPKLTDEPDVLFDQLAQRVPRFPRQSAAAHHQAFLDLCAELLGRRRWVERSGGSTQWATSLLADYPTAKIVYLTRNWPDTATSMSRHPSFQLVQLRVETQARYGIDPFDLAAGRPVPPEVEPFLPDRLTVDMLRERGSDVRRYVSLCAFLSSQAEQALSDNPPRELHCMTYEDLLADAVGQLTALGGFLGFTDPAGWAAGIAHRVRAPERTASMTTV
jgi:putative sulfotransferase